MEVDRFKSQLRRQLGFLDRSCESFDRGFSDEAIRIGTIVRVLVHQTGRATSLLTHLRATDIRLTSTCMDISARLTDPWYEGKLPLLFNGMGSFSTGPASYRPKLGNTPFLTPTLVAEWWMQTVFVLDRNTALTRRTIALVAADKDGGAHVDASLTTEYERLVSGGDLGSYVIETTDGERLIPITGHHYVALRQMGYELLNSPELIALAH